jgi:hypothetical protein
VGAALGWLLACGGALTGGFDAEGLLVVAAAGLAAELAAAAAGLDELEAAAVDLDELAELAAMAGLPGFPVLQHKWNKKANKMAKIEHFGLAGLTNSVIIC